MLITTKIYINIINNNNSKATHTSLQIDVNENIDGQNNNVTKYLSTAC